MFNQLKITYESTKIFLSICFVCCLSCSNNTEYLAEKHENLALKSNITAKEYKALLEMVASNLEYSTRSTGSVEMTENEARKLLIPFIEDGKQIQHSLIDFIDKDFSEDWHNMTETDLITISFLVCSINQNSTETKAVSSNQIFACLGVATGLAAIKDIGIGGLVNAKTALQVIKAVGKRYLGYIGVALMIADFATCIGE